MTEKKFDFYKCTIAALATAATGLAAMTFTIPKNQSPKTLEQKTQQTQINSQTFKKPEHNTEKPYKKEDLELISQVLYAEAADQPRINRVLIGECILNRKDSDKFPNTISEVVYQEDAFTCIKQNSFLWQQATRQKKLNPYDMKVAKQCIQDARQALEETPNIKDANKIIAYHDTSIKKPSSNFWNRLEEVYRNDKLIFYKFKDDI